VTRDYVIGLEVVLPTGEIMGTGVKTMKGVVGYDLTRLIVGSEGTLAIITKIFLRLIPKPEATLTLLSSFDAIERCSQASSSIIRNRIVPAKLELIDRASIECVAKYEKIDVPPGTNALLLIELDGEPAALEKQAEKVAETCRDEGAIRVDQARSAEEAEAFWKIRQAISPALMQLNLVKINEDVVVPPTRISELVHALEELKIKYNLTIVSFGHAGDGNIHVNVMYDDTVQGEQEKAERAVGEIFQKVIALGGTLSGEHGVGITKAPYLRMELSDAEIALMKKIKRAFDPNDILNPGKIFWESP
jgi:glycolate oxidase